MHRFYYRITIFFILLITLSIVKTSIIFAYAPPFGNDVSTHSYPNKSKTLTGVAEFYSIISKTTGKIEIMSISASFPLYGDASVGSVDGFMGSFYVTKEGYQDITFKIKVNGQYYNVGTSFVFGAAKGATDIKIKASIATSAGDVTESLLEYKTDLSLGKLISVLGWSLAADILNKMTGLVDFYKFYDVLRDNVTPTEEWLNQTKQVTLNGYFKPNVEYRWRLSVESITASASLLIAENLSSLDLIVELTEVVLPDTTPPTVPGSLSASAVSTSQINLGWSPSTDSGGSGLAGYKIERCTGSVCTNFAQVATPVGTGFSNTGLNPSTTYRYRVRAYDNAGNNGNYSTIVSATTQAEGAICSYSLASTSVSFPSASGATGSVGVTATGGCSWTASSNANWITITAGSIGSGNGIVSYAVSANTGTSARSGTITIAGKTFTVNQPGAAEVICSYSLSYENINFPSGGGIGEVSVITYCAWTASSNVNWITITAGSSGSEPGILSYSVSANTGTSARSGTMTIAGQTLTVNQPSGNAFVRSSSNAIISDVTVTDAITGAPSNYTPETVVSFRAFGVAATENFSIEYLSLPADPVFYKVLNGEWQQIYPTNQSNCIMNVVLSENTNILTFTIADNSACDGDPTLGVISDPVVAGSESTPPPPPPSPSSGGGGGGGCFIATAAWGSYLDPHVQVLRSFRDHYLITNGPGRAFIEYYYSISPPIAGYIKQHESLRNATRYILTPIVYGLEYPWLVLIFGGVVMVMWNRKKRKA